MISGSAAYAGVDQVSSDQLVRRHAALVKRIAGHLMARLPDAVQMDDLIQAGMLGLLEAAQKFENGHGASFETFAGIRIRGAMLDDVRRGDWAPRSVHRNSRRIAQAINAVERREGRSAQDQEVADELEVGLAEYRAMLHDSASCRLMSSDELAESGEDGQGWEAVNDDAGPAEGVERDSFRQRLAAAITELPEREQMVLSLYYNDELNLKEIGLVLGVTESRVSQIRSQAALRLRGRLSNWT